MLRVLGLNKYEGNLKKGLLTDNTIMLWNEAALTEARIPPGPRLLILHHLDTYRNPSSILKPALPLPMLAEAVAALVVVDKRKPAVLSGSGPSDTGRLHVWETKGPRTPPRAEPGTS